MILTYTGYTYQNEQDALKAIDDCRQYYGIPTQINNVTQYWCSYYYDDNFFYIIYNETLLPVLGQPIEFQIIIDDV